MATISARNAVVGSSYMVPGPHSVESIQFHNAFKYNTPLQLEEIKVQPVTISTAEGIKETGQHVYLLFTDYKKGNAIIIYNDYDLPDPKPVDVPLLSPVAPSLLTPTKGSNPYNPQPRTPTTIGGVRRNRRKTVNSKKRRRSNKRR